MRRKIAAILAADIAGYSRLIAEDEEETVRRLAAYREVFDDFIKRSGGRIFNTAGDSVLAEFPSAVDALRCAIDVQESLRTRNLAYPPSRQMTFRMGLTIGDVVEREGDLLGDGVNIAARLQTLGKPGSVCLSKAVYDAVANKLSAKYTDMGPQEVKNIPYPVHAFSVTVSDRPRTTSVAEAGEPQEANRTVPQTMKLAAGLLIALVAGAAAAFLATQYQRSSSSLPPPKSVKPITDVESKKTVNSADALKSKSAEPLGSSSSTPEVKTVTAGENAKVDTPAEIDTKSGDEERAKPVDGVTSKPADDSSKPADEIAAKPADEVRTKPVELPEASGDGSAPAKLQQKAPDSKDVATLEPQTNEDDAAMARARQRRWLECNGSDTGRAIDACQNLADDTTIGDVEQSKANTALALAYRKTGKLDEAVTAYTKSIKLAATADAYDGRGIAYLLKSETDKALRDFDQSIKLDNQGGDAYNNRAWTYFKLGRGQEALDDANKAVTLIPEKADVWDTRAHIHEMMGNKKAALDDFQKAVSIDGSLQSAVLGVRRLKSD